MISVLTSLLLALLATAVFTPLVRRGALAFQAVDRPNARKVHVKSIPRLGGIAIVAGFFSALLGLFALRTSFAQIFFSRPRMIVGLAAGAAMLAVLGLFDDLVGVGAKRKLAVQTLASLAAYFGGLRIDALQLPYGGTLHLYWLALPATVIWILAVINAMNLIDGLDGLAAGIGFFACATNFVVAYLNQNLFICLLSATLAGAILGFLIYNFNPATIFMGDSGSMFLGFALATTSLMGSASQKSPTVIAILVPLLALGLPIMDMLFAIVRRFLERRSIFSPDRGHIHHRLLDLGLTHRRAVLTLYGVSLGFTLIALAIHVGRSWRVGAALVLLTVSLVGIVRFVGYFKDVMQRQQSRKLDATAEALRRLVPVYLRRIDGARGTDDVVALLKEFADDAKLLALHWTSPDEARLRSWRWQKDEKVEMREAVSAHYSFRDDRNLAADVVFFWDSSEGQASPQAELLLQLMIDAAEAVVTRPARARLASSTGRLRPVS